MKSYNSILFFSVAVLLTACNSNEDPKSESNANEICFTCTFDNNTRVSDTSFDMNDKIGVYVTKADENLFIGGNVVNNELFSYNGSVWTATRKVYWNEGSHNVYAYYPYSVSIDDTEDYTFDVQADQSTASGFKTSDFVWAGKENVTASASPVNLQFSHCMSKAIIKLEKGEGFEGELPSDCEVYIHNTFGQASIDLASGGVYKNSEAGTKSIKALKINNSEYQAIVVPQNIEARRPLVEVICQGVSYMMDGKLSFKPGYAHTLVVTLSKNPEQTKIEIGGTIGGWN